MLKRSDLELGDILGKGNFASVVHGTYRLSSGKVIDVAVKVPKVKHAAAEVSAVFSYCYVYWRATVRTVRKSL